MTPIILSDEFHIPTRWNDGDFTNCILSEELLYYDMDFSSQCKYNNYISTVEEVQYLISDIEDRLSWFIQNLYIIKEFDLCLLKIN